MSPGVTLKPEAFYSYHVSKLLNRDVSWGRITSTYQLSCGLVARIESR